MATMLSAERHSLAVLLTTPYSYQSRVRRAFQDEIDQERPRMPKGLLNGICDFRGLLYAHALHTHAVRQVDELQ
jgi:hypothetical protein